MSRPERWLDRRLGRQGMRPRDAAYLIGAFWAVAVVVFGVVERVVDPKTFHTVWLGMWWAIQTVTTVGYGDVVPDQTVGKVIAAFLMLGGLSLVAVVTAAVTSGFVSRAENRRRLTGDDPVLQKLDQIGAELQSIRSELDRRAPAPPAHRRLDLTVPQPSPPNENARRAFLRSGRRDDPEQAVSRVAGRRLGDRRDRVAGGLVLSRADPSAPAGALHPSSARRGLPERTSEWWSLPILAIGALLTALAIRFLPGKGGHVPAKGLAAGGASSPNILPGVILAGLATIGFGLVLGPEAPLIALGGGLAAFLIGLSRRETPPQALMVATAAGAFAAVVHLQLAADRGDPDDRGDRARRAKLRVILIPGLLAAGIGSLVSLGMGAFTGLSTSAYAIGPLPLSATHHPKIGEFGWTIALAIAIAVVTTFVIRGGLLTYRLVSGRRLLVLLPIIGLIIGGLAIAFSQITGKGVDEVLFSGQDQLPGLVSQAGTWSLAALTWLLVFKGLAYLLSLGSYRGGPTFPAMFLGAAAGIMASHLPGFAIQAAIGVGIGAAVVAVLRLPLSAIVIATVLTSHAVPNLEPLIIVGVVVSYVVTVALSRRPAPSQEATPEAAATPQLATPT